MFGAKEVGYAGFLVREDSIQPTPKYLQSILDFGLCLALLGYNLKSYDQMQNIRSLSKEFTKILSVQCRVGHSRAHCRASCLVVNLPNHAIIKQSMLGLC